MSDNGTTHGMDAPVCVECEQPVESDEQFTQCRVCQDAYHLECADVLEVDKNFGCGNCYVVPGNLPRRRRRGAQVDHQEQADTQSEEVPAQVEEGSGQVGMDDQIPIGQNRSTPPPGRGGVGASGRAGTPPYGATERTASGRVGNVRGTESGVFPRGNPTVANSRDDQLLSAMKHQGMMLTRLVEILAPPATQSQASRVQPVPEERVEWDEEDDRARPSTGRRRVSIAPPTRNEYRVQPEDIPLHSTRREDRAIDVTRISTTEDFMECLAEAKQGLSG